MILCVYFSAPNPIPAGQPSSKRTVSYFLKKVEIFPPRLIKNNSFNY
ncbi:hypothetical protein COXBURSA334_1428 [Coxiella burnetii Q321]|nr:hypothetical protein COXBURSA334_1428 [Coxiella burnetii Q321]